ncbi:hypothetical protein ATO67_05540 [Agrobacterium bohemicum]|uniref:Uncharacterized protein n=1 Tax=Agrobacterium bohemicum TaxID=2052828 RepID=A0A135P3T0_9HYPH|nr:hypothetical protein ATO67_05540 [Agrobacterium bohemicum]
MQLSAITVDEHDRLLAAAKAIFFRDRTYKRLVQLSISDGTRASEILVALRANTVNQKLQDAQLLIQAVIGTQDRRFVPRFNWKF